MTGLLETGAFLGFMALLYFGLISRHGILARRVRQERIRRARALRKMRIEYTSQAGRSSAPNGRRTESLPRISNN